jgi:hypothetical protein
LTELLFVDKARNDTNMEHAGDDDGPCHSSSQDHDYHELRKPIGRPKRIGTKDKVQLYYSQLHLSKNKGDIGNESRHKWSHQIQNEGNRLLPLYGVMYTGILNGQTDVLGEGELVDITHADEGGLASQEGVGDLRVTVSTVTLTI